MTEQDVQAPTGPERRPGYWRLVWRQFRRHKLGVIGLVVLILLALVALLSPFLAHDVPIVMRKEGRLYVVPALINYDDLVAENFYERAPDWAPGKDEWAWMPPIPFGPNSQTLRERLEPPGGKHWLGTDDRGRSVVSRLIWGTRISLTVGFVSMGIAVLIGVIVGALAGFYGGWVDATLLRVIEIFLCFPSFFLILTLAALLPPSIYNVMIALGIVTWTGIARLERGEFLRLRESEFTLAARASGLKDSRVIFRHVLPNALAPVLVSATFGVAGAIIAESSLSFLGFGTPPPTASWGELLKQASDYVYIGTWWLVIFPGLAIFVTVTAFNLVGEGLRDAMDPRLRE